MVKPPLRTKSIGFKVSEEEYARLETAAQASGRTLGEWCREAILRGGSASDDPALAEIVGVRLLLVNVLRPLAAGEKLAPEAFDKMLDQISEVKHEQLAAVVDSLPDDDWHRHDLGGMLTEVLSLCWKHRQKEVENEGDLRQAFLHMLAVLCARQVPEALHLRNKVSDVLVASRVEQAG